MEALRGGAPAFPVATVYTPFSQFSLCQHSCQCNGKAIPGSIFSISAYINNQWTQGKVSYDVCLQRIYKLRISG